MAISHGNLQRRGEYWIPRRNILQKKNLRKRFELNENKLIDGMLEHFEWKLRINYICAHATYAREKQTLSVFNEKKKNAWEEIVMRRWVLAAESSL